MDLFDDTFGDTGSDLFSDSCGVSTNPASGLPMLDHSCIDVAGNPLGTNLSDIFDTGIESIGGTGLFSDD